MPLIDRQAIENRERQILAPYAAFSSESKGRVYPQAEHPLRTAYQRDRDRIVHSAAFRRMEYKTQVFIPHEADHFRTRLTHTIEVAQVSRTLARNLKLNEDLTEAVALVHDLGHTPFGHSGEDILDELLVDLGGFNHNRQSLRIVDLLEERYPDHPGLNLTYEVREGIVKHETKVKIISEEFHPNLQPCLEAAIVDKADELTYNAHDTDDGLSAGIISLNDLKDLSIWDINLDNSGYSVLTDDQKRYHYVRFLIDQVATDLLEETTRRLKENQVKDRPSLQALPESLCRYSEPIVERVYELKDFLKTNLYNHPKLCQHGERARKIITCLFNQIMKQPTLMPSRFIDMLKHNEPGIVVADYIAGMTDRFAEKLYGSLKDKR